jgi:hypothetical protein
MTNPWVEPESPWLTVEKIARRLRMSSDEVKYHLVRDEWAGVRWHRVGPDILVDRASFEAWLASRPEGA